MITNSKTMSVLLNIDPKYLHPDTISKHVYEQMKKLVVNQCFQGIGKVIKIKSIKSIETGKIHHDTGFSKTPVTFIADVCLPIVNTVINGKIDKFDHNGGIYVNCKDISIFCLNTNLSSILNHKKNDSSDSFAIGDEVYVKITKVNFNYQSMIVIGKIL